MASDGQPGQDRETRKRRARQRLEGIAHLVRIDPGAVAEQEDRAAIDRQRAERHDDRRNIELPDQQAIDRAEGRAKRHGGQDDQRDRHAGKGGIDHRRDHAGQRQIGGHGQVDAARQDDGHLAKRQDDQDRGIVVDAGQIGRLDEAGETHRDRGDQHDDGQDKQNFAVLEKFGHYAASTMPAAARTSFSAVSSERSKRPAMRPSRMTMTRSAMPMISGISEETMMTLRPCPASSLMKA